MKTSTIFVSVLFLMTSAGMAGYLIGRVRVLGNPPSPHHSSTREGPCAYGDILVAVEGSQYYACVPVCVKDKP